MDKYTSIRPGQIWLDTEGKRIHAHGGSIMYVDGKYYWYGENKEKTLPYRQGVWHYGMKIYSSDDLYNWKDKGFVCVPEENDPESPLNPYQFADRPHIIYNKKDKRFVMWLKIMMSDGQRQYMAILVSDTITGPFKHIKSVQPLGMFSGDFDLYVEPDTEKAYIIFEKVHTELIVADLTEDYTDVTGKFTSHFPQPFPPFVREAPAFFVRNGKKYLFTSGTTGYFPNPSEVAEADDIHGPWTILGDPHVDEPGKDSYNSQITSVFKHPFKKDLYIALADRWLIDLKPDMPNICDIFEMWFNPDKEKYDVDVNALTAENTSLADYVWLPVTFENGMPVLHWYDEWKIEDFE